MNKGNQNVCCFSQFRNSYGTVQVKVGFFKPLVKFYLKISKCNQAINLPVLTKMFVQCNEIDTSGPLISKF